MKIAAAVASLEESLRVATIGSGNEPRVLIAMGAAGVPSRVLAGRFGSCWTYAGDNVAPGQIDLRRMRDQFRAHAVSEATAVYGVLGSPIGHSLSPAMHNAGFRATGVDAVYLPLEAAGVDDFLAFARAVGLQGASVTAPYKEQIAAQVEEQDATSRAVGAVNTLRSRDGGGWEGLNTDVPGLLAPLEECVNLAGARATVIGAREEWPAPPLSRCAAVERRLPSVRGVRSRPPRWLGWRRKRDRRRCRRAPDRGTFW